MNHHIECRFNKVEQEVQWCRECEILNDRNHWKSISQKQYIELTTEIKQLKEIARDLYKGTLDSGGIFQSNKARRALENYEKKLGFA